MSEVNLLSDTQTLPTAAMRRAIAAAEVGDEQLGEDPTVNSLQERVASLLDMPSALFVPSGTMCNAIALMAHLRPGDEVLLHRESHPAAFEAGGPAALAGAMLSVLDGEGGMFSPQAARAAIRPPEDRHQPLTRLLCVEQTTNLGGGRVWPLEQLRELVDIAREHGLRTHMDGARLLNAAVASGVPAREWVAGFDTAWIDLSKGLGAPVGAVLAGGEDLIAHARVLKQRLGGFMRQAGIVAAAGLYALEHHVDRLAEDHARARRLAEGLAELPGVSLNPSSVHTNIVVFTVAEAAPLVGALAEAGVRVAALDATRVRAVTHLDIEDEGIDRALVAARRALGS